jgi:hypothetical protein
MQVQAEYAICRAGRSLKAKAAGRGLGRYPVYLYTSVIKAHCLDCLIKNITARFRKK